MTTSQRVTLSKIIVGLAFAIFLAIIYATPVVSDIVAVIGTFLFIITLVILEVAFQNFSKKSKIAQIIIYSSLLLVGLVAIFLDQSPYFNLVILIALWISHAYFRKKEIK